MTRRRALAVFVAALALLVALNALVYSLYRSEVNTVDAQLDDRLLALGGTAARWLATDASHDPAPVLSALASENRLEDAYVVDDKLRVIAGVHTGTGSLNLLRVDGDRLDAAQAGHPSAGMGYSIANVRVEVAYFSIDAGRVLALEAGSEFHAPTRGLRTTYLVAVALSLLVALIFAVGLGLALRALERARLAHGRAERLAVVGQMAAMVAHEVRNPLGILRGQVELARERLAAEAPAREHERFVEMVTEIDRLNHLTEQFLGLTREVPLELATVDLGELIEEVADRTRPAHPDASIETTAPLVRAVIAADANRLRQALLNLLLNALQVGGKGVAVTIDVTLEAKRARITVADDGPGVRATIAADLFEPFVTTRPGGTGLGLAVARRIAESHGGSLVLESTPGRRGAVFSIYLPVEGI